MTERFDITETPFRRPRFDRKAMLALMDAGALPHDRRIEMIDGELLEMNPARHRHGSAIVQLAAAILPQLRGGETCVTDAALFLTDNTMLAPDLTVLPHGRLAEEAKGDEVLLVIEVADSTLRYDLNTKAQLYAANRVREYWVVELGKCRLHIHRDPTAEGYLNVSSRAWTEQATPLSLPDLTLTLAKVLRP